MLWLLFLMAWWSVRKSSLSLVTNKQNLDLGNNSTAITLVDSDGMVNYTLDRSFSVAVKGSHT